MIARALMCRHRLDTGPLQGSAVTMTAKVS